MECIMWVQEEQLDGILMSIEDGKITIDAYDEIINLDESDVDFEEIRYEFLKPYFIDTSAGFWTEEDLQHFQEFIDNVGKECFVLIRSKSTGKKWFLLDISGEVNYEDGWLTFQNADPHFDGDVRVFQPSSR